MPLDIEHDEQCRGSCDDFYPNDHDECVSLQDEPICPECECPISKHDSDGCHELLGGPAINDRCDCKRTPADLQPPTKQQEKHCINDRSKEDCGLITPCEKDCKGCDCWQPKEQPAKAEPQMPLIDSVECIGICQLCDKVKGCVMRGCHCHKQLDAQRDADMAWHNEQKALIAKAAVAEFAEKLIKDIDKGRNSTHERKQIVASLRAAKEGM